MHKESDGNYWEMAHMGVAVMSNAEHGNTSFQVEGGVTVTAIASGVGHLLHAGDTALWVDELNLPPFFTKLGHYTSINVAGGYRPVHDGSVNGNWTYGVLLGVNVPIQTTFSWLAKGL